MGAKMVRMGLNRLVKYVPKEKRAYSPTPSVLKPITHVSPTFPAQLLVKFVPMGMSAKTIL